jgi:rhodanese-related sulfurtransferase
MGPFGLSGVIVNLLLGFGFGFALERAGFGNARNLAAQFYLHDQRVLKVMFTAIVTAMMLIFASSALGLLDTELLWVPPTHLGPAVLAGLLFGVGFIVGGYCPGTAVVSAATLKLDGVVFVLGCAVGVAVFNESVASFQLFWDRSGDYGRFTLPEWLQLPTGLVVLGVAALALGMFWGAEKLEGHFGRSRGEGDAASRASRYKRGGAVVLLLLALGIALVGQPAPEDRVAWKRAELEEKLASRAFHIDPGELLSLMHNNQIRLVMLDVREEVDFNVFHLVDARHVAPGELDAPWVAALPAEAVKVIIANDEARANEAWQRLYVQGVENLFILAGGLNLWLDVYLDGKATAQPAEPARASGRLRHEFAAALGDQHPASRPNPETAVRRVFETKVVVQKPRHVEGGGCG